MIDVKRAEKAFKEYLKKYDIEDEKVKLKMVHTYGVVKASEYLSEKLKLKEDDKNLAKVIALLHDIGRFEQSKFTKDCYDKADMKFFDHAQYGVKVLFEDSLINNFVEDRKYDEIINKAISNHNRLDIQEGLSDRELLHAKIIRDADKIDNFRVKYEEKLTVLFGTDDEEKVFNDTITNDIYKCFMSKSLINTNETKTYLDRWASYMAFIFDLNFEPSFEYLKETELVDKCFNRIKYNNIDTKIKINSMHNLVDVYINEKVKR